MLKNKYLSRRKFYYFILFIFSFTAASLLAQDRNIEQLYDVIEQPVLDIQFSSFSQVSQFGLLFALSGAGGGLAYFTEQDNLNIFSVATNLGAVSLVPDEESERIFCALGDGSNSDGLYEFDLNTQEFSLIDWYFFPRFVKKLSSGFYCGYGAYTEGGLVYSATGDQWAPLDFFQNKFVTDVEETEDGTLLVAADEKIYLQNEAGFSSYQVDAQINDIYVRQYPHNGEVYIASGIDAQNGSVYQILFDDTEISGLSLINNFDYPNALYEYLDWLVVGCRNNGGLFLVEPVENGDIEQITWDFGVNDVYCFEFFPIYTPNFMVGTDVGIFLATNLTSSDNVEIAPLENVSLAQNYPNPANPNTRIDFKLTSAAPVKLTIFNSKGQKVKTLVEDYFRVGEHSAIWNGQDEQNRQVSSGVYYYHLQVDGAWTAMKKCLIMK